MKRYLYLIVGTISMCIYGLMYNWTVFSYPVQQSIGITESAAANVFSICQIFLTIGGLVSGFLYYKINYKLDSNNYDIYVAVAYENITTDSGISYATTELHATTLTIEDYDVWGFESEEDLYNSLPNTYDAKIIATNGLYKK